MMASYTMHCPRCDDGILRIYTHREYHAEYPGGAWEPESIEGIKPDCDCWYIGDVWIDNRGVSHRVLTADLWDIDTSRMELVE